MLMKVDHPDTETFSVNYLPNAARWSIQSYNNGIPVGAQSNDSPILAQSQTNDILFRAIIAIN